MSLNTPEKSSGTVVKKFETAASCHAGRANALEKPPPVKLMARSGAMPSVEPTEVTQGHDAGKTAMNVSFVHWLTVSWLPRTPPSPEALMTETPRAPMAMYPLQILLKTANQESSRA